MGAAPPGESYNMDGRGTPLIAGASDYGEMTPSPKRWTTEPSAVSRPGDILVCVRATIGNLNWSDAEYCLGRGVAALRPRIDHIDPRYLAYYIDSNKQRLAQLGTGSTFLAIRRQDIENFQIPLPPLSEQKRIADILDKADTIRRKRQEAIGTLESSKVAAFHEFFGDPIQNSKHWARQPLGELLECIDSGISPRCLDRPVSSGEWGILKLGAVTWCEYDWTQNKALPDMFAPDPSIEVKQGDLLFTRKNTYELVAATAFVYQTPPQLMLPDLIFRLRLSSDAPVLPEYLWGLLTYPSKRRQVQTLAGGAAGSMPNISKAKLLQQLVEVPPIRVQESYAGFLHQVRKTQYRTGTSKNASDNLFNSLVQRAFKGEL